MHHQIPPALHARGADLGPPTRRQRMLAPLIGVLTIFLAFALAPVRGRDRESGMTTAEYAVGTIAACGFAAILYQVVTGDSIISALSSLISRALSSL